MGKNTILLLALAFVLSFSGCSGSNTLAAENSSASDTIETGIDMSDMFTDRDMEIGYDAENSTQITLSADSASASSDAVQISGSTVTITDEGTYLVSGTLNDGMIIVNAEDTDKIQLVLNGVDINSATSAAIYVLQADKVFITTASESENTLSNGGEYVAMDDNNIDSVIFAKSDLTLNGAGILNINAAAGHGVVSKDDLVLTSGTYNITAASHGLSGKDSVRIANGTYQIVSGKDGIHSENADDASLGFVYIADGSFDITSDGDGISANDYLLIEEGEYTILSGGGSVNSTKTTENDASGFAPAVPGENGGRKGMPQEGVQGGEDMENGLTPPDRSQNKPAPSENAEVQDLENDAATEQTSASEDTVSTKGLKAVSDFIISGGTFTIDSADDSLHSNGNVVLYGATFEIASGDDGIHADSAVEIYDGCTIDISQSYEGIEGLSIDILGGNISLVSSDDGFNAAGGNDSSGFLDRGGDNFGTEEGAYINISGGEIAINASGDGIDSNGDLNVSDGTIYISGPADGGNSAIDYAGEGSIDGGVLIATGSSQMAQNFGSASTQGVMMVSCSGTEGSEISLCDDSGKEIIAWQAEKEYTSVIISCPEITEGATYTLTTGDTTTQVTMDSLVYGSGGMNGGRKEMGTKEMGTERPERQ